MSRLTPSTPGPGEQQPGAGVRDGGRAATPQPHLVDRQPTAGRLISNVGCHYL